MLICPLWQYVLLAFKRSRVSRLHFSCEKPDYGNIASQTARAYQQFLFCHRDRPVNDSFTRLTFSIYYHWHQSLRKIRCHRKVNIDKDFYGVTKRYSVFHNILSRFTHPYFGLSFSSAYSSSCPAPEHSPMSVIQKKLGLLCHRLFTLIYNIFIST